MISFDKNNLPFPSLQKIRTLFGKKKTELTLKKKPGWLNLILIIRATDTKSGLFIMSR